MRGTRTARRAPRIDTATSSIPPAPVEAGLRSTAAPIEVGARSAARPIEVGARSTAAPIEVGALSTAAALEALAPAWLELWERTPAATPFQTPAWLLPWWRRFGHGELLTFALYRGGRLAGLAPLFVEAGARRLVPIGLGNSDSLDVLLEPELGPAGAACLLERLAAHRKRWARCDLEPLPSSSPLLNAPLPSGMEARIDPYDVSPVLILPSSTDALWHDLSRHQHRNFRQSRHRLERAGDLRIEAADRSNLEEHLEALFRLHGLSWEARGEPGVLATPEVRAFHREAAAGLLELGQLRLYALRLEGAIIASLYGFAGHGRFYCYLGGFDPAFAYYAPGSLLVGLAIEAAIGEGLRTFDFLRGAEAYKYAWGARDARLYRLSLRGR
jgi:CelD/BcsL family acetyltransferase involved in cellulose biosynthesis